MTLKERVEIELKKQKRSLSWLALKIEMTVDGLRGSLVTESIKYSNIVRVCEAMGIKAGVLFGEEENLTSESVKHGEVAASAAPSRNDTETSSAQAGFKDSEEMIRMLKEQIRDKERIIELLSK